MTIQELRVFLQSWTCGCGDPAAAVGLVRDVLRVIDARWTKSKALNLFDQKDRPTFDAIWKEEAQALDALLPSPGVYYFVLYLLTEWDLLEHGGSVGGSWLTEKGKAVLAALNALGDDLEPAVESACIHGYTNNEPPWCPECVKLNESLAPSSDPPVMPPETTRLEHPGVRVLPYERLDDDTLMRAIRLYDGDHLLVLQPFGWHLDANHIPNMAEQFSREYVCEELRLEVVCEYGPYVAVVRKADPDAS